MNTCINLHALQLFITRNCHNNLPTITAENENYATYKFILTFSGCNSLNNDDFIASLEEEVMSYPECMSGYSCNLDDTDEECDTATDKATVNIVIKVFCESTIGECCCVHTYCQVKLRSHLERQMK